MGCCCSGHEEAKKTQKLPPMFGKDVKCTLKRQGFFGMDADFNVYDDEDVDENGKPKIWLLLDAVGTFTESAYDFYLKYRHESMETSATLGCVNMKKEDDYVCAADFLTRR